MAGASVAWGLDVGASSLKAIKLRRDGQRVTVEAFEVLEHDKFLTEPNVDRDALIRATLQKFAAKYAVKRDAVYIGVPGSMTFARFVKLPPVETKKIPEIVRFEAIQQIPFPLDQVNWDYHTFQHPESPDVEVGIFAMKKELVVQVMSNFNSVGLNVQGVQMSPLAVYNAAAYDGMTENKGTIVIDMGAEHTDLVVLDSGRLWLRTINIGGNHFTDALAKSFKQPFARAETLKKTAATSKYQKQIYQAMRPIFADLVAEIQRSIGHYNSTHRDSRLERVVGMGNPFKLPNLQKYVQQELKMDVERLEHFRQANVEKAAAFSEDILSMTAAYGLAVQALGLAPIKTNLLPMEIARKMMWRDKKPWFIGAAALVVLGSVANAAGWWMADSSFKAEEAGEAYSNNMSRQAVAQKQVDDWNKVKNDWDAAQKQLNAQFQLVSARKVWPMLTADLFAALPQAGGTRGAAVAAKPIVVTGMTADYVSNLSATSLLIAGGAAPGAPGSPPADPAAPAGAAPAPVAAGGPVGGVSEHGFVISITGYVPGGGTGGYTHVDGFRNRLVGMAPTDNANKPYYLMGSEFHSPGHVVRAAATAAPAGGGFGAFGGGGPASAATAGGPSDKPWGNVKGPFWDVFIPNMVNYHPQAAAPTGAPGALGQPALGMSPMAISEFPFPVDMYLTRATEPPELKSMNDAYTFTLRFKVHIKNEIK